LIAVLGGSIDINLSKRAYNTTQNRDATTSTARKGDVITYTLSAHNSGSSTASNFVFEDNIADVLQLAELVNYPGATYNSNTHTLTWQSVNISSGSTAEKTFTVRVKNPVPTNTDYVMTNIFGNQVDVLVERPFVAPPTGATSTISFVLALISVFGFFLYRRFKAGKIALGWVR
jgi:uncharacterized repeat protein (TIGR01451 family)